jgi:hypothetical protein
MLGGCILGIICESFHPENQYIGHEGTCNFKKEEGIKEL